MNRSALSLIGVIAALAAITGVASLTGAGTTDAATAATAARLPVERSALLCPEPSASEFAATTYTSFTPQEDKAGKDGSAELLPAPDAADQTGSGGEHSGSDTAKAKSVVPPGEPGKPVTATTDKTDAPALIGTAEGKLAPGWTVQQTTVVDIGTGRGVLGTSCTVPDSEFWFPGVSTSADRQDYVHLTNPDDTAAVVDLELYSKDGALQTSSGDGITVPAKSTVPVLLSTLTTDKAENLTLHVTVRTGRVGAVVQAVDTRLGSDWLPASADPADSLVMPGIPADATSVRLVVYATGSDDADLKVRLATPNGAITPAGHETLHVKSGMTATIDLGDVTMGEAGSLILTPTDDQGAEPIVAALRITRGKGADQETAFLPATAETDERATAADNRAEGASTLSLVAPDRTATVKVTSSAGGTPVSRTVTVKAGTTLALEPPKPSSGKGAYAVTVEPVSGGPVYASRMLALPQDGIPMFTIQPMPDDRGTVAVPGAGQDLSILN